MADAAMTFLEFFAGGGMAREGLGPDWACLFANDIDPKKGAADTANWAADRFIMGDVGTLTVADARSGAFWPFMNLMQGLRAQDNRDRKRHRLADVAWRQGL